MAVLRHTHNYQLALQGWIQLEWSSVSQVWILKKRRTLRKKDGVKVAGREESAKPRAGGPGPSPSASRPALQVPSSRRMEPRDSGHDRTLQEQKRDLKRPYLEDVRNEEKSRHKDKPRGKSQCSIRTSRKDEVSETIIPKSKRPTEGQTDSHVTGNTADGFQTRSRERQGERWKG